MAQIIRDNKIIWTGSPFFVDQTFSDLKDGDQYVNSSETFYYCNHYWYASKEIVEKLLKMRAFW